MKFIHWKEKTQLTIDIFPVKTVTDESSRKDRAFRILYVSMIENGRRRVSLDALIRIANILGVTVDELLNGNQMYNPTEYQTDMDLLLADCSNC